MQPNDVFTRVNKTGLRSTKRLPPIKFSNFYDPAGNYVLFCPIKALENSYIAIVSKFKALPSQVVESQSGRKP